MAYRSQKQRESVIAIVNALVEAHREANTMSFTEETLAKAVDAYLVLVQPAVTPADTTCFQSEDYLVDTEETHDLFAGMDK